MLQKNTRYVSHTIHLGLLLALVFAVFPAGASAFQGTPPPPADFTVRVDGGVRQFGRAPFQITPPGQARVGEMATLEINGGGIPDAAGFLFTLRYDETGLDFVNAELSQALTGAGVDILAVGPVRKDGVVYFGAVTCPVADCTSTDYAQPRNQQPGHPAILSTGGNAPLARLNFYVRAPGRYALTLGQSDLVNPQGLRAGQATPQAAPQGTPQGTQKFRLADLAALDLTQNGVINDADAETAIGAWADLTAEGRCITPAIAHYDIDKNGCIDLPDFQTILAHWGEATTLVTQDATAAEAQAPTAVTAALSLTVNDSGDDGDASPGNGFCATSAGRCTLRAAIQESNASVGADTINFNIRNADGSCPALVAIQPTSNLHIDDSRGYGVLINGYSQCNAAANTGAITGNAVIKIEIRGNQTSGVHGLFLNSQNNTIRGLAIYNFNQQLLLRGSRSHHNKIEGNFIGTNAANTHITNFAGENNGIYADRAAANNTIGGATPDKRNLISGNDQDGVNLQGAGVSGNIVVGNYIGLKQDGVTSLRNSSDGVDIAEGASGNRFGGLAAGERNVIAGNGGDGVEISHGGASNNEVVGNLIGLNATGSSLTRNNKIGLTFEDAVTNNRIYRNIIVGNGGYGVRVYTSNANQVYDNFIGVYPPGMGPSSIVPDPTALLLGSLVNAPNGTLSNGSGKSGVLLMGGSQNTLIQGNVIANHPENGVAVSTEKGYLAIGTCETYFNKISENFIYNNTQKGIRLINRDCGGTVYYANQRITPPRISSATTTTVTGTTCANCVVEVFLADKTVVNNPNGDNNGEGKVFLARGAANASGSYSIAISGVASGAILTATTTDPSGNTSEFARNVAVR